MAKMFPVYPILASDKLLKKYILGKTQNANGTMAKVSKTSFCDEEEIMIFSDMDPEAKIWAQEG